MLLGVDTHTHTHAPTIADETISRNQARTGLWPAQPGLTSNVLF